MSAYDAVILAGGASKRMGGGDKTGLVVDGMSLLDRAISAVAGAQIRVAVGPARSTLLAVTWTREEPAGGGPAAALAAGLALVSAPTVVALAADMPFVSREAVDALVDLAEPTGAVLIDEGGTPQWLLSAWPRQLLAGALSGQQHGRSLRGTLEPVAPTRVSAPKGLPVWFDCDEPADIQAAKELSEVLR